MGSKRETCLAPIKKIFKETTLQRVGQQHSIKIIIKTPFPMSPLCSASYPLCVLLECGADGRVQLGDRGVGRGGQRSVLLFHLAQRLLQAVPLLGAQAVPSLRQEVLHRADGGGHALCFALQLLLHLLHEGEGEREIDANTKKM